MAVLVEGISVIVKASAIASKYPEGWEGFKKAIPNQTFCADGELVRVGFMSPNDVKAFVEGLEGCGLTYLHQGKAQDLVVVDQARGPTTECDWIEYGKIDWQNDPQKKVSACRIVGSKVDQILTPDGWAYEKSLSLNFGFVATGKEHERLVYLKTEDKLEVYVDIATGEEVYIGRTS
jgi:hypothetical protein